MFPYDPNMTLPNGIYIYIYVDHDYGRKRVLRIDIPFGLDPIRHILVGSVNLLRTFFTWKQTYWRVKQLWGAFCRPKVLKMDGWKTAFLLGPGLFSGATLLVLGRVITCRCDKNPKNTKIWSTNQLIIDQWVSFSFSLVFPKDYQKKRDAFPPSFRRKRVISRSLFIFNAHLKGGEGAKIWSPNTATTGVTGQSSQAGFQRRKIGDWWFILYLGEFVGQLFWGARKWKILNLKENNIPIKAGY